MDRQDAKRRRRRRRVTLGLACFVAALGIPAGIASAAYPGANGAITFVRSDYASGVSSLFAVSASGANLTHIADQVTGAAWSADGTKLAYIKNFSTLYVVSGGGTPKEILASPAGDNMQGSPSFSPDGATVVLSETVGSAATSTADIIRTSAAGGQAAVVTSGYQDTAPHFSPDGSEIVFSRAVPARPGHIFVMNADGSNLKDLTGAAVMSVNDQAPDFAPDGRTIAFSRQPLGSGGSSSSQIFRMNADGSSPMAITPATDNTFDSYPAYSPDGTKIVFARNTQTGVGSLFIVNLGSGSTQPLNESNPSGGDDSLPSWQPTPKPQAVPPRNIVPPSVEGPSPPSVGVTFTADAGTWTGTTPIIFTYTWKRCNSVNLSVCAVDQSGPDKTYRLTQADALDRILLTVMACNDAGCAEQNAPSFSGQVIGFGDPQFSPTARLATIPDTVGMRIGEARAKLGRALTYVQLDYKFQFTGCEQKQFGEVVDQVPRNGKVQLSADHPVQMTLTFCLVQTPEVKACDLAPLRDDLRKLDASDGYDAGLLNVFLTHSLRCQHEYDVKIANESAGRPPQEGAVNVVTVKRREDIRSVLDCPQNASEQDLRLGFSEGASANAVLVAQKSVHDFSFRRNGPEGWTLPAGWESFFKLTVNDRAGNPVAADVYVDASNVGASGFRQQFEVMDNTGSRIYTVAPRTPGTINICAVINEGGRALWGTAQIKVVDLPPGQVWETITGRRIVIPTTDDNLGANPVNADLVPRYKNRAGAATSLVDVWQWIVDLFGGSSRAINAAAAASNEPSKQHLRSVYGRSALSPMQINTCGGTLASNPPPPVIGDGTVFGQENGNKYTDVMPVVAAGGKGCGAALLAVEGVTAEQAASIKNANGGTLSGIVAQGGGNIVAQGGGNIVAQGGGNVISNDGSTLISNDGSSIVSTNGNNVVAQGGGNIVSTNGNNVLGAGGGNAIAPAEARIAAAGAGQLISNDGSSIVAQGGGNLTP